VDRVLGADLCRSRRRATEPVRSNSRSGRAESTRRPVALHANQRGIPSVSSTLDEIGADRLPRRRVSAPIGMTGDGFPTSSLDLRGARQSSGFLESRLRHEGGMDGSVNRHHAPQPTPRSRPDSSTSRGVSRARSSGPESMRTTSARGPERFSIPAASAGILVYENVLGRAILAAGPAPRPEPNWWPTAAYPDPGQLLARARRRPSPKPELRNFDHEPKGTQHHAGSPPRRLHERPSSPELATYQCRIASHAAKPGVWAQQEEQQAPPAAGLTPPLPPAPRSPWRDGQQA